MKTQPTKSGTVQIQKTEMAQNLNSPNYEKYFAKLVCCFCHAYHPTPIASVCFCGSYPTNKFSNLKQGSGFIYWFVAYIKLSWLLISTAVISVAYLNMHGWICFQITYSYQYICYRNNCFSMWTLYLENDNSHMKRHIGYAGLRFTNLQKSFWISVFEIQQPNQLLQ